MMLKKNWRKLVGALLSLFVLPGVGYLVAGKYREGMIMLVMALVGISLLFYSVGWTFLQLSFIHLLDINYLFETFTSPYFLLGNILFSISSIWSIIGGIRLSREYVKN